MPRDGQKGFLRNLAITNLVLLSMPGTFKESTFEDLSVSIDML